MKASDGKNRQTDVVGNARKELEMITGQAVITSQNATELNRAVIEMIETSVHME